MRDGHYPVVEYVGPMGRRTIIVCAEDGDNWPCRCITLFDDLEPEEEN